MSAATLSPAPAPGRASAAPHPAAARRLTTALRAVRVFAGAAFDVVVLGVDEDEAAGVRRRR
ncbi:hypothetical protein AB0E75_20880 [Streptomyces griseoviridis]|uniref:Uncharacterized protein n=3 Tax=Streptomyces TaxID=1883 RepID=A0A918GCT1_STRGD|nr:MULTISPECIES: hypothetical protein [Streptomyces]MDP9682544.1 hypothetical protein [Streptomyces griseoviridis]GGS28719.1 hypothetical protein GCM10010238_16770 [Streptomyces niveoruber]GGS80627.1 hypothetical protein GCM10010240_12400 [Streptomyces griseoviridis]GGU19782.1 hypothetical protein GCM10010259_07840 [Streptomyces daghestanicus]GHI32156.1 hypothetical protein Sdagh_38860 [Streptomyces daghestanicus]